MEAFQEDGAKTRLCGECGQWRPNLSSEFSCRECRNAVSLANAFAGFLLRFDRQTPKIPTVVNPEYREWVAWAKGRAP